MKERRGNAKKKKDKEVKKVKWEEERKVPRK
jgi:hypothetical protein